jgi:dynein heavy chain
MSAIPNPLSVLSDEATVAGWNNFGLPPDRVSTENGSILTNSERYSLIIDP